MWFDVTLLNFQQFTLSFQALNSTVAFTLAADPLMRR